MLWQAVQAATHCSCCCCCCLGCNGSSGGSLRHLSYPLQHAAQKANGLVVAAIRVEPADKSTLRRKGAVTRVAGVTFKCLCYSGRTGGLSSTVVSTPPVPSVSPRQCPALPLLHFLFMASICLIGQFTQLMISLVAMWCIALPLTGDS